MTGPRNSFYSRSLPWTVLFTALGALMCFIPLLNELGYGSSLILAPLAALMGIHLGSHTGGLAHPNSRLRHTSDTSSTPWFSWVRGVFLALLPIFVPLVLLLLNAFRVKNCNMLSGLGFYALLPLTSMVVGVGWGVACALFTGSDRKGFVLAIILGSIGILFTLYQFYSEPRVVGYGSSFGYWAGVLYDEDITIPGALIWARMLHLSMASLALSAATIFAPLPGGRLRLDRIATLVFSFVFTLTLHGLGLGLGFRTDGDHIRSSLGSKTETPHFTIYHPPHLPRRELDSLADDLEYRLAQTSRFFGLEPRIPDQCESIEAYIYTSVSQRRQLVGLGGTSLAKPWSCQIHLIRPHPGEAVVAHEIAHVVASRMASGPLYVPAKLRLAPVMGLVEGAAEAATIEVNNLDHHQRAAVLKRLDLLPDVEGIMDAFSFWGAPPARAYAAAGSFVRWLIKTQGIRNFTRAYKSGSIHLAYRKSVSELVQQWSEFLDTQEVSEMDLRGARARYQRPSVFDKVCAHESARLRTKGRQAFATGDWDKAITLFAKLCSYAPNNPDNHMALARTLAASNNTNAAEQVVNRILDSNELAQAQRANALQLLGDLAWRRDQVEGARAIYQEALAHAGTGAQMYPLRARMVALGLGAGEEALRDYLTGEERESAIAILGLLETVVEWPYNGLAYYLLGEHLFNRRRPDRAVTYLQKALELGAGDPSLKPETKRLLGMAHYARGEYQEAIAIFTELSKAEIPNGMKQVAADWIARCRWRMKREKR